MVLSVCVLLTAAQQSAFIITLGENAVALVLLTTARCSMDDEHRQATSEMLARRTQRMKELYEAEFAQLARELDDMGLVITKKSS